MAIARRDGLELTPQQFNEEFDVPAQPVVVTSIVPRWRLMNCVAEVCGLLLLMKIPCSAGSQWIACVHKDLVEQSGTELVRVIDEDDAVTTMPLSEYLDRVSVRSPLHIGGSVQSALTKTSLSLSRVPVGRATVHRRGS
jgi:hypothetical protein